MLKAEENEQFIRVGPGTPMGDLLRRYWHPIAAVAQLDEEPTKPVRLLGEDLVLYKDKGGAYGLLDLHCAHRRADLSYGFVEDRGLRCNYHGWLYDEQGRCIEQPFEEIAHPDANFKEKTVIKAYPVEPKAGLLWAYLGPLPAPLVPDWDIYHDRGYKQIVFSIIPCNWFQCQENSIDPVHLEWLHSNWSTRLRGKNGPYVPTHLKVRFDEFEFGFQYKRVREDTDEQDPLWTVGRVCLWPECLYTGSHFEWRVPIDDDSTLSVGWFIEAPPGDEPFEQERIPYWHSPVKDPTTGRWISSHTMNQDFIAWVGQGILADRSLERLGESDRGIIILRQKLMEQMKLVADGGEPMGVIRDAERNHALPLPRTHLEPWAGPGPAHDGPTPLRWLAGQPKEVLDDMERVWAELRPTPAR